LLASGSPGRADRQPSLLYVEERHDFAPAARFRDAAGGALSLVFELRGLETEEPTLFDSALNRRTLAERKLRQHVGSRA
jgi:hypothetical protein